MATTRTITRQTQIVHIGSGASIAAAGFSLSTDESTALSGTGNLASYPLCDVALMIAPTASIALASNSIVLYRQDLNFDSTNDETVPGASHKSKVVGVFVIPAATTASTTHYVQLCDVPLPGGGVAGFGDCRFFLENTLGVNIPAGWTLKISPKTDFYA